MAQLLDNSALACSSIVANSLMNRERGCTGGNSYEKELALNPIAFLMQRLQTQEQVTWLDICCGAGKALLEAAYYFQAARLAHRVQLVGVDLAAMFLAYQDELPHLHLEEAAILTWEPQQEFDLITCVHGLHYLGDKLLLLQKAAAWLKHDGLFISHLDPANLRWADGSGAGTVLLRKLQKIGFQYKAKKHLLSVSGQKQFTLRYKYLGADDQAGPNYTGQAAVNSYYKPADE